MKDVINMNILLILLSLTLAALPGILLRYLPFVEITTFHQKRKLMLYYSVCFILQCLFLYLFLNITHYNMTPSDYKSIIFLNSLFYVIINILVIKNFFYQHLLIFGMQSGFSFLIHSIVAILQGIYGENLPIYIQFFFQSITYLILISIITFLIWKYLKASIVLTSSVNKDYFWHIIWLVPALTVYSNVLITMNNQWINTWQQFLSRLLMGAAIILSWRYINLDLKSMKKMFALTNTNKLLSIQTESIQNQIKTQNENNKKMSILKHDMSHHLLILASLIENNNISEATLLISQLNTTLDSTTPIVFCKNTVINSTILIYNQQAETNNIKILSEINIPDSIPWNSNDLAILFANAFENAIQASLKQPIDQREIHIKSTHKNHKLVLQISNRFDKPISFAANGLPITKESNHGIGMQSILSIVNKYKAQVTASQNNDWFTLSFLFTEPSHPKNNTLY